MAIASDPVDRRGHVAVYTSAVQKFYKQVSDKWTTDTSDAAASAAFGKGDFLSARHILFPVAPGQEGDSLAVMKKAQGVLARTTAANFGALAKQYGSDGTKDVGGDLGVSPTAIPRILQRVALAGETGWSAPSSATTSSVAAPTPRPKPPSWRSS
jgi:parvulin-like peptidyl-prolyl isomerase